MSSPAKAFIQGVVTASIDDVWHKVKPLILRALEYCDGKYSLADIHESLKKGEMQLWVVSDENGMCAFCITRIVQYPREKRATILFASGEDMVKWISANEVIKDWATTHQCDSLEVYGREGWTKVLAPYGYKKIHTVLRVDLPKLH